ncbi:phospholipase A(2) [Nephila pilipes]|uniref:Phospholipase A2 n=1 Tax=Nephila pilipes TaxID=299642 RepID=A0A8X6P8B1_NEPPI|nr:phospholipase A(2) [Nephila pilipes]
MISNFSIVTSTKDRDISYESSRYLSEAEETRSIFQLGHMIRCQTGCDPLRYKRYGCFCGFKGAGKPVDVIDYCCLEHDWCYARLSCPPFMLYVLRYTWLCRKPGSAQCKWKRNNKNARINILTWIEDRSDPDRMGPLQFGSPRSSFIHSGEVAHHSLVVPSTSVLFQNSSSFSVDDDIKNNPSRPQITHRARGYESTFSKKPDKLLSISKTATREGQEAKLDLPQLRSPSGILPSLESTHDKQKKAKISPE